MLANGEQRGFRRKYPIIVTIENPGEWRGVRVARMAVSDLAITRGGRRRRSSYCALPKPGGLSLASQQLAQGNGIARIDNFRWPQPLQLRQQRSFSFQFGGEKISRGQIRQGQAEGPADAINARQKIIPLG